MQIAESSFHVFTRRTRTGRVYGEFIPAHALVTQSEGDIISAHGRALTPDVGYSADRESSAAGHSDSVTDHQAAQHAYPTFHAHAESPFEPRIVSLPNVAEHAATPDAVRHAIAEKVDQVLDGPGINDTRNLAILHEMPHLYPHELVGTAYQPIVDNLAALATPETFAHHVERIIGSKTPGSEAARTFNALPHDDRSAILKSLASQLEPAADPAHPAFGAIPDDDAHVVIENVLRAAKNLQPTAFAEVSHRLAASSLSLPEPQIGRALTTLLHKSTPLPDSLREGVSSQVSAFAFAMPPKDRLGLLRETLSHAKALASPHAASATLTAIGNIKGMPRDDYSQARNEVISHALRLDPASRQAVLHTLSQEAPII